MPIDFPEEGKQLSSDSVRLADASTPSPLSATGVTPAPPNVPDHELLRRIGGGSYGEVWLARNALDAYRAVKIVHRHNFEHDRPFEREFEGIQKFEPISRSHEGLVDLLQVGRNDVAGYFYYVMELADDAKLERSDGAMESWSHRGQPDRQHSNTPTLPNPAAYEPHTLKGEQHRGRLPLDECIQLGLSLTDALAYLHEQGLVRPPQALELNRLPSPWP
jgi:serine/threonine protein kinase